MGTQSIEQLNNAVRSISPTDLVYLIIGLSFRKHQLPSIARDDIYEGFAALSTKYPDAFAKFYFVPRGGIHHSNEIEDILFRLGGVMSCANPRYQNMDFPPKSLEVIPERFDRLLPDKTAQEQINQLAEEFFMAIQHRD